MVATVAASPFLFKSRACAFASRQVTFVDLPDPDNLVAVLAVRRLLLQPEETLHVVVTGRPSDLAAKSIPPAEFGPVRVSPSASASPVRLIRGRPLSLSLSQIFKQRAALFSSP